MSEHQNLRPDPHSALHIFNLSAPQPVQTFCTLWTQLAVIHFNFCQFQRCLMWLFWCVQPAVLALRAMWSFLGQHQGEVKAPSPHFPEDTVACFSHGGLGWAVSWHSSAWVGMGSGWLNPTRDSRQFHFLSNILPKEKSSRTLESKITGGEKSSSAAFTKHLI